MNRLEWAIALAVTAIWGMNFSVIKYGVAHVDPLALAALRFSLCALPLALGIRRPGIAWHWILIYGLCFGAGTWGLMTLALYWGVAPGLSAWLLQAHAFFTPVLAWVWLREPVTPLQRKAMVLTFVGFITVLAAQDGHGTVLGLVAVGGAALCISITNLLVRRARLASNDALPLLVWSSPVSAVVLFGALSLTQGTEAWTSLAGQLNHAGTWASLAFQAFPVTLIGYALWTRLIVRHGATAMAPLGLLVPMWALVFAGLWQGLWPTPRDTVGLALIALGLAFPWLWPWWVARRERDSNVRSQRLTT